MNLGYPYTTEPQEGGGYLVQFVDLQDAFTEGETLEDAATNAAEVLSGILAHRAERGQAIPEPSPAHGYAVAYPSPQVQAALLLRAARGDQPLTEMAKTLRTSWAAAQRLEDATHWPSLKQVDRAARALGKRLVLRLE
jgi:antitoxin HicB